MAIQDKGEQILDGMLLDQYQNSPNLKEYFMAYIAEMDFLFEQIELVYVGRFLNIAIGAQLDVLGKILQQSRSVVLPNIFFGFQGAAGVISGMADEATPNNGGVFLDENSGGYGVTPLDDTLYRRVLKVVGTVSSRDSCDINLAYYCISILLDRVPSTFSLTNPAHRQVVLELGVGEVTDLEVVLIEYMAKYFIPDGMSFTINRT
tara:strand:- start:379 stop:993 length:615 start_codon:yes stop_codon:yes gene_type:complete